MNSKNKRKKKSAAEWGPRICEKNIFSFFLLHASPANPYKYPIPTPGLSRVSPKTETTFFPLSNLSLFSDNGSRSDGRERSRELRRIEPESRRNEDLRTEAPAVRFSRRGIPRHPRRRPPGISWFSSSCLDWEGFCVISVVPAGGCGGDGELGSDSASGVPEHRNRVRGHRNVAALRVREYVHGRNQARRRRFGRSVVDSLHAYLNPSA